MGNEIATSPVVKEDENQRSIERGDLSHNTNNNQRNPLSAWKDRFGWGGGASLEDREEESRPTFRDLYMLQSRIGTVTTCAGGGWRDTTAMISCCVYLCV